MQPTTSSVGLEVLDAMIAETAGSMADVVAAAVEKDAWSPTWARSGAEMGVGIRLAILGEARERVLTAEMKRLEGEQR